MVKIGGSLIFWCSFKIFGYLGMQEFVIWRSQEKYRPKEYVSNYLLHEIDVVLRASEPNQAEAHQFKTAPWKVALVSMGKMSQRGGSIGQVLNPSAAACEWLKCHQGFEIIKKADNKQLINAVPEGCLRSVITYYPC